MLRKDFEQGDHLRAANRIDMHVGRRIRLRREMLGYTRDQLAGALDVSESQIIKYERGAHRVSAGSLFILCKFLDVPAEWFFKGFREVAGSSPDADAVQATSAELRTELLELFDRADDERLQGEIVALAQVLVGECTSPNPCKSKLAS